MIKITALLILAIAAFCFKQHMKKKESDEDLAFIKQLEKILTPNMKAVHIRKVDPFMMNIIKGMPLHDLKTLLAEFEKDNDTEMVAAIKQQIAVF